MVRLCKIHNLQTSPDCQAHHPAGQKGRCQVTPADLLGQATPQQFRRSATRTTSDLKACERLWQGNLRIKTKLGIKSKHWMHPLFALFALALLDAPGEPHSWFQEKSTQKRHQHREQEDSACKNCKHRWWICWFLNLGVSSWYWMILARSIYVYHCLSSSF